MQANHAANRSWAPTDFAGIERCLIRNNEAGGRTSMVRLKQGARFPRHAHQAAEDVVVLAGAVEIGGHALRAGDHLFTEAGEEHDVVAIEDAVIFVSSQKPTPFVE